MASGWELTDWEKRREWYSVIKLGKDVTSQTALLKKQSKEMIAAQASSANAIITSHDGLREGLDNLAYRIEDGMDGLKAAFEFGISEVVWQIEQNRQVLKNILEVLMAPLDTQAKELRSRAEDAYANGWLEDALDDFIESEKKNKYDFSVHISIGMINLFQKVDREKALEYFEKAVKYARPKSQYHTSFALMHVALIKRDLNQIAEAEKLTAEAIELTPEFAEALYQNAQYNAQLNNVNKMLTNLEKAVKIDRYYCMKADTDEMFNSVRKDVNRLFKILRDELVTISVGMCDKMDKALGETKEYISGHREVFNDFLANTANLSNQVSDIRRLLNRNSYFDSLNAQPLIKSLFEEGNKLILSVDKHFTDHFNKEIAAIQGTIRNTPAADENDTQNKRDKFSNNVFLIIVTWVILVIGNLYTIGSIENLLCVFAVLNVIFVFGGWFVGQWILRMIASIIFQKKDFSGFIKGKQRELESVEKYHKEMRDMFSSIKSLAC